MKLQLSWDEASNASDRLAAHLHEVARERDPYGAPVGHAYVQAYVTQQLTGYGVVTAHEFGHLGRTHQNLVLDLPWRPGTPPGSFSKYGRGAGPRCFSRKPSLPQTICESESKIEALPR